MQAPPDFVDSYGASTTSEHRHIKVADVEGFGQGACSLEASLFTDQIPHDDFYGRVIARVQGRFMPPSSPRQVVVAAVPRRRISGPSRMAVGIMPRQGIYHLSASFGAVMAVASSFVKCRMLDCR